MSTLRWLMVMPVLATQHASADPGMQQIIETVFSALTTYGGGVGEILGVSLFMSLSLELAVVGAWVNKTLAGWLAGCAGPCQRAAFVGPVFASFGYCRTDSDRDCGQPAVGLDAGCRGGAGLAAGSLGAASIFGSIGPEHSIGASDHVPVERSVTNL